MVTPVNICNRKETKMSSTPDFECGGCGAEVENNIDPCPECGSTNISPQDGFDGFEEEIEE